MLAEVVVAQIDMLGARAEFGKPGKFQSSRWIIFLDGPTYLGNNLVGSQKKARLGTLPC